MQDHPLVDGGEVEQAADLLRGKALDVAEREDRLLDRGEHRDRCAQLVARLERAEPALGVLPRSRRQRPVPGPGALLVAEAAVLDRWPVVAAQRGERHGAALPRAARLG